MILANLKIEVEYFKLQRVQYKKNKDKKAKKIDKVQEVLIRRKNKITLNNPQIIKIFTILMIRLKAVNLINIYSSKHYKSK